MIVPMLLSLVATTSFAAPEKSREPASIDVESKMLRELERTLETRAAEADQRTADEAPILDRANQQASDRPQYREDY